MRQRFNGHSHKSGSRKKIFTWHVHGSYLLYLTQADYDFYVPFKPDRGGSYGGRAGTFPWGDNLHEIPAEDVRHMDFDAILFQNKTNYLEDKYEVFSTEQLELPKMYLEHDPPREHPTDTRHVVDDPDTLVVHVTHFNRLMWDCRRSPTHVIDHGVFVPPGAAYTGEVEKGLVVINELKKRGRRLGADIFEQARRQVPLELFGMKATEIGGAGEIDHNDLPYIEGRYRFFFNPIRYTSLGLAVIEAMMVGMPIVGLATTEMVTAIQNGVSGYVETDVDCLIEHMKMLLADPAKARKLGEGAREYAYQRFNIERFKQDWSETIEAVTEGAPLVKTAGEYVDS